ncbi:DUF6088 family protein [Paraglaciecola chathamensis]|uniref:Transcriptional regulator, AbiEi antitoxin, Type IV TA system n=1 Tax=Paraglaciecola chathamensis TaxID=368405 RepID=A0A8H9IE33_9ALTE|nr:DUF6088 family protein [Paraglaciecola oceanifecundans]GGZ77832.1 hypothetical protein GCM10011274_40000 [Paraglaciecola oceanifecundans]
MSVAELVNNKLARMKRGAPFSIERFYTLGSVSAVQKKMSRLVKEGKVVRVAKGIYSRPKPLIISPTMNIVAKAEDVARVWAETNNYKLSYQGMEAAYRLGLQTQAPMKSVFWTSGPTRTFRVGNQEVQVKHAANSKLVWYDKPEGELFRGLMFAAPEHTTVSELSAAMKRLNLSKEQNLKVISKLLMNKNLSMWSNKLLELRKTLLS